jgi:hypothetical protein
MDAGAEDKNPNGEAPETILVMDLLNSSFEDFAYIRYEVEQFLKAQPARPLRWLLLNTEAKVFAKALPSCSLPELPGSARIKDGSLPQAFAEQSRH